MKLRYYKDKSIYFCILGIDDGVNILPILEDNIKFESLKECMLYIHTNKNIKDKIIRFMKEDYSLIVSMQQINDSRDSTKNNILYNCESVVFKFDNTLRLKEAIFDFRKNIDPRMSSAIYDCKSTIFTYTDQSVIIMDFLKNDCLDIELAHFLLYEDKNFMY